jgi:hypothetical protein
LSTSLVDDSVILGDAAPQVLREVSRTLRNKTLRRVGMPDGGLYSPWLSCYPVLDLQQLPPDLLTLRYAPGKTIADGRYLRAVAEFLRAYPALVLDELIGSGDDWALHVDVEQERPEMVDELDDIVAHVRDVSPILDRSFDAVVEIVVPLRQPRARGLSSELMRGAIFLGYPPGNCQVDLALDLAHEMGHQSLALLRSCDPLFASDPRASVYSEVRHTERPAIQSLHAAAAIAFMLRYLLDARIPDHRHPDFEMSLGEVLARALHALLALCRFTDIGEQVISDFRSGDLTTSVVGPQARSAANQTPPSIPPIDSQGTTADVPQTTGCIGREPIRASAGRKYVRWLRRWSVAST